MFEYIEYKLKWWMWFLSSPTRILYSKYNYDILKQRWLDKEPKRG